MPNMRKPTFSAQIGSFMDTPERAALIKAWASHLNVTHGSIMRDVLDSGLPGVIRRLTAEHGELPAEVYEEALRVEQQRAAARTAAGIEAKRAERALPKRRARKKAPAKVVAQRGA